MKKMKAILVDDEESARNVLSNLLARFCPEVELCARCENVLQAVDAIETHQPDLVFLDIEMPNYSGFEIVQFFEKINFQIIFITAYEQYALKAFEIAAIDYLLKPIDIERLKNAVSRTNDRINLLEQAERLSVLKNTLQTKQLENLVVSDRGQQHILPLNDIIAIEAMESYCTIHTVKRQFTVSKNLKFYENMLEENNQFIRSHKSWLLNVQKVERYSKTELSVEMTNGLMTKLSKYKKNEFESMFQPK